MQGNPNFSRETSSSHLTGRRPAEKLHPANCPEDGRLRILGGRGAPSLPRSVSPHNRCSKQAIKRVRVTAEERREVTRAVGLVPTRGGETDPDLCAPACKAGGQQALRLAPSSAALAWRSMPQLRSDTGTLAHSAAAPPLRASTAWTRRPRHSPQSGT
jgi:hypothetical protein